MPTPPYTIPIETEPAPQDVGETIINQGTVPSLPDFPDANQSNIKNDDSQIGYIGWGCTISYSATTGLVAQPIAGNSSISGYGPLAPAGATCDVVRHNSGMCFKIITAVATRMGVKPVMPSLNTNTPNDVLHSWNAASFSPPNLLDGVLLYGIVAQFIFVCQRPPDPRVDSLDMGTPPFTTVPAALNILQPSDFVDYIVGPAQPVSNMPTAGISY